MKLGVVLLLLVSVSSFVSMKNLRNHECIGEKKFSLGLKSQSKSTDEECHSEFWQDMDNIPAEIDWREKGRVSAVQEQKGPYCWAFATTALLEGQMDKAINLSEQQLVDCINVTTRDYYAPSAIDYIRNNGIMEEKDYSYTESRGQCKHDPNKVKLRATSKCTTTFNNEQQLKALVARKGPVMVGLDKNNVESDKFEKYAGGVYSCIQGGYIVSHAVVVVGYGVDQEEGDYWIIKNSWGDKWGEEGYMRMAQKNSDLCSIYTEATTASIQLVEHNTK